MIFINYIFCISFILGGKIASKSVEDTVSYQGHQVIRMPATEYNQVLLQDLDADIWSKNDQFIQARLDPRQLKQLKQLTGDAPKNVVINNVQRAIEETDELRASDEEEWFCAYHTYSEILMWFSQFAKTHPKHVKLVPSIGKSYEGRDIFAVHLTNPSSVEKKTVWFQSLIHAREWITGTSTQFIFNHLLERRHSDHTIKKILDHAEIVFIPIVNPDGYVYSRVDRLVRKNRHLINGGDGVDLNRNFPSQWGGPGASKNPHSQTYLGPHPASEPETKALINYFTQQTNMVGAIDFHSYSELILRPFAHNNTDTPDEAVLKKLGDQMSSIIEKVSGKKYANIKEIDLYASSGSASDYYYGEGRKVYSYAFELSPNSKASNGFLVPPSEIIEVGKDILPAAIHFLDFVTSHNITDGSNLHQSKKHPKGIQTDK